MIKRAVRRVLCRRSCKTAAWLASGNPGGTRLGRLGQRGNRRAATAARCSCLRTRFAVRPCRRSSSARGNSRSWMTSGSSTTTRRKHGGSVGGESAKHRDCRPWHPPRCADLESGQSAWDSLRRRAWNPGSTKLPRSRPGSLGGNGRAAGSPSEIRGNCSIHRATPLCSTDRS